MKKLFYILLFLFAGNIYCQNCSCSESWHDPDYAQRIKSLKKGIYCCKQVDSLPHYSSTPCNNPMYFNDCFREYISEHLPGFNSLELSNLEVKQTVVVIGFIIKPDGSVADAKIVHYSLSSSWDVAHLSAVKKSPKFVSPAKVKGLSVDYYCEVNFEDKRIY